MANDRCNALQSSRPRDGRCGRQPRNGSHKRGLNTKIHLAVDAHGMPLRAIVTSATEADCTFGGALIEGIGAEALLADRGYDTDALIEQAREAGMEVVIPPKKNRLVQRHYDKYLYKLRHLFENAIMKLKRWRGIATRYAKNSASFLAAVHIRCIAIWLEILA